MNADAAGAFAKKEMVEHRVFGKEALEEAEKLSLSENSTCLIHCSFKIRIFFSKMF